MRADMDVCGEGVSSPVEINAARGRNVPRSVVSERIRPRPD